MKSTNINERQELSLHFLCIKIDHFILWLRLLFRRIALDMFTNLIMVIVSQVHIYVKDYCIVHFK